MVIASTGDSTSLEQLAQLADKIVEVAMPSVSAVTASSFMDEMEQLHSQVVSLKRLVQSLSSALQRRSPMGVPPATLPNQRLPLLVSPEVQ